MPQGKRAKHLALLCLTKQARSSWDHGDSTSSKEWRQQ